MLKWQIRAYRDSFGRQEWHTATISSSLETIEHDCERNLDRTIHVPIVSLRFSIHPRQGKDCHSECWPYQLLFHGRRWYVETVDEGKAIAERIAKKVIDQLVNCTKEYAENEKVINRLDNGDFDHLLPGDK